MWNFRLKLLNMFFGLAVANHPHYKVHIIILEMAVANVTWNP
jgi:hypothetical protein